MNGAATRILLARRASGREHAAVFEPEGLRVEGGFAPRRRVAYRAVHGLERAGAWLWVGCGPLPVGLGGRDVPAARLAALEAELRARIAALPDGASRLARLDARRPARPHFPWLALALVAALALALAGAFRFMLATDLLLALGLGLVAERWLGRLPLLASGLAAALAAAWLERPAEWLGLASLAARVLPASWIGLLAFARLRRERELSVLARSAFDLTAPLAFAFAVYALASGMRPLLLGMALLVGFATAKLVLRRTSS
jgi:hypothetical protein